MPQRKQPARDVVPVPGARACDPGYRRHRQRELSRVSLCCHNAIEYVDRGAEVITHNKVITHQMNGSRKQFVGKAKENWGKLIDKSAISLGVEYLALRSCS